MSPEAAGRLKHALTALALGRRAAGVADDWTAALGRRTGDAADWAAGLDGDGFEAGLPMIAVSSIRAMTAPNAARMILLAFRGWARFSGVKVGIAFARGCVVWTVVVLAPRDDAQAQSCGSPSDQSELSAYLSQVRRIVKSLHRIVPYVTENRALPGFGPSGFRA
jgi:hypothetical protein